MVPGEVFAPHGTVEWFDEPIVLYRERQGASVETIDILFDGIERITAHLPWFLLLVDLTEASRPDARFRDRLRARLAALRPRLPHVAMFTGSLFVAAATPFIFGGFGVASVSVHRTQETAVEALRRAAP